MGRRQFMNLLTFGSVAGVALGALYPVVNYFIPPKAAGSGGGTTARGTCRSGGTSGCGCRSNSSSLRLDENS